MKTVVVFCSLGPKPSTIQAVEKLYGKEPFQIICTSCNKTNGINAKVTVPLVYRPNQRNIPNNVFVKFNTNLSSYLGTTKVDLFIFEYCPGMHLVKPTNMNRVVNILKKHSKNNSRVITHALSNISPNRLVLNRQLEINRSVNKNYRKKMTPPQYHHLINKESPERLKNIVRVFRFK